MFHASIQVQLGDGNLALFWTDRWNNNSSPCTIAPNLCNTVRRRTRNRRLVAEALHNKQWISDVVGSLTVQALHQYVLLWHQPQRVQLTPGVEDIITWRWEPSGVYSARSAYKAFFVGSGTFPVGRLIWKAWAPMKVRFFMWLACRDRLWKTARRQRRGLQDNAAWALCDQETENVDHLFACCSFTQQIWHGVSSLLRTQNQAPAQDATFIEWWLQNRRGFIARQRRRFDSSFMLVSWMIWKERNSRVFRMAPPSGSHALVCSRSEAPHHPRVAGASGGARRTVVGFFPFGCYALWN